MFKRLSILAGCFLLSSCQEEVDSCESFSTLVNDRIELLEVNSRAGILHELQPEQIYQKTDLEVLVACTQASPEMECVPGEALSYLNTISLKVRQKPESIPSSLVHLKKLGELLGQESEKAFGDYCSSRTPLALNGESGFREWDCKELYTTIKSDYLPKLHKLNYVQTNAPKLSSLKSLVNYCTSTRNEQNVSATLSTLIFMSSMEPSVYEAESLEILDELDVALQAVLQDMGDE